MAHMLGLPPEVHHRIFSFVSDADIAQLSLTCLQFYRDFKMDIFWRERCWQEYKVKHTSTTISSELFYKKVLHPYGMLLGVWKRKLSPYGGLLVVKHEDGMIRGVELRPSVGRNVKLPLRCYDAFSISVSSNGESLLMCNVHPCNILHGCEISIGQRMFDVSKLKTVFSVNCLDPDAHRHTEEGVPDEQLWIQEESDRDYPDTELLLAKFIVLKKYNYNYSYLPLKLPPPQPGAIIQPGLFTGTYGIHGQEIVHLTYEKGGKTMKTFKISGDPNVPAGKVTFMCDLSYSMILTREQQFSILSLNELPLEKTDMPLNSLPHQPFVLPRECWSRIDELPTKCIGRFNAKGHIAGMHYRHPSYSRGHWLVFDENTFGFMWLELLSFSLFHRIPENLELLH